jgi:NADH:ubiquinone oxidoreductase subunit F (NADH-binding)
VTTPSARERAVASYFADLGADPGAVRICRGTSCLLAGSGELASRLPPGVPHREVHCLGYCDRSPALLWPDGRVAVGADAPERTARDARAEAPEIRSLVRTPIATRRVARGDFSRLGAARAAGAYAMLERWRREPPERLLDAVERSGEQGRGGASFPTGAKWRACTRSPIPDRVVVANGDEGDPGSFVDRVLMERDPHAVLEGMALCAHAVGAGAGVVYVRSEYPEAIARMQRAIEEAGAAGLLASGPPGAPRPFAVHVESGRGSYVCGEETALFAAVEGRRGEARPRPPWPVQRGLHGIPTVVNNVETLANVPAILEMGADAYAALGTPRSRGTKALCLNQGFARPGIVEAEFGTPLAAVIEAGGGGRRPLAAVLLGGPMGSLLPPEAWDVPVCFGAMAERGIRLGHGGLVAIPEDASPARLLRHLLAFAASEACGRCVPCALGSARAAALARQGPGARAPLERILELMEQASLCGFGQLVPGPIRGVLERFGDAALAPDGGA